jgi:Domain of unknown function (DUF4251)
MNKDISMKKIIIIVLISFLYLNVSGQNNENKKLTRTEKKEIKRIENEKLMKRIDSLIEIRQFVLEADYINTKQGRRFEISSSINFIEINKEIATFQFGSEPLIGINNLGGGTVKGDITKFDVQKNEKKGFYYIRLSISSFSGTYNIGLKIYSANSASAVVSSSLLNRRLEYFGRIVSFSDSNIIKGF